MSLTSEPNLVPIRLPSAIRVVRRARVLLQRLRPDRWTVLLLLVFGAYVGYWSYLSIAKYYALAAGVYDLGLGMQSLWNFTQVAHADPLTYARLALYSPVAFLLSPIALADSYPLLLFVQTVALASAAFPLYITAKRELKFGGAAFALSAAYLLYFPLAGVNWFDFHFESFFALLFLLGYALYSARWFKSSVVLFFLAGATWYPYILLIGLFSLIEILGLGTRWLILKQGIDQRRAAFSLLLLILSVAYFAFQFTTYNAPPHSGLQVALNNRVIVLALMLLPVLLMPFLSLRWLLMLAPFAYLEFTSGYAGYSYPAIFAGQYSMLFIPFVFLGTIEAVALLSRRFDFRLPPEFRKVVSSHPPFSRSSAQARVSPAYVVLLAAVLLSTVFQPYGPFNQNSPTRFDLSQSTQINWTAYDRLLSLVHLIPQSTPYVLFQNDMPELLPRPLAYEDTPLITSLYNWQNLSNYDAVHNSFPLELTSGQVADAQIDYAIDNPYSNPYAYGFYDTSSLPNVSMYYFVRTLYASGYYGILGEAGGLTVFERGYNASPEVYVPYTMTIPATQLFDYATRELSTEGVISAVNPVPNEPLWWGPYATFSPGWYSLNFSMLTSNNSPENRMYIYATWANGGEILGNGQLLFNGSAFPEVNQWTNVEMRVYMNNTYGGVQFSGFPYSWTGEVAIRSIQVTQISPGPPTFTPTQPTPESYASKS